MNNKEFNTFFNLNKNKLPFYFKDFKEFKLKNEIEKNKIIEKNFHNEALQTKMHKVEKFYKSICRFD
ncbi:MAG: hypothetical protein K0R36_2386 [Chryseobacterium sp.]|jgi:hypothetical protein|nr:hypothetical protein [Chryseobacterium sp.]